MPSRILRKLLSEGRLGSCVITFFQKGAIGDSKTILGKDIKSVTLSHIEHAGGETGYEIFRTPLESVLRVDVDGRTVFRRKKRIKRIYPRH